jgi:4'-phosphopantetheinyl transferase EntD
VIEELSPRGARWAEPFSDRLDEESFPEEEAAIARAVGKRRREFVTTRACARDALAQLGVAPVAIPVDERGEPRWPRGVVGSMTHCEGLRAAVVVRESDVTAIGIDAEPNVALPEHVYDVVAVPADRQVSTS